MTQPLPGFGFREGYARVSDAIADLGGGLVPIPDQRMLGNISGGAAVPVPLTAAQILALLGITPYTDVRTALLIRAQALCGPTLNVLAGTEFDTVGSWVANGSLSGSGVASITKQTTVEARTGALSTGQIIVAWAGNLTPVTCTPDLKTARWYSYWRGGLATAVDAATGLDFMLASQGAGNSRLSIGVAGALSTTNFRVIIFDSAGNLVRNTPVAQVIDTNTHDIEAWNDGTNINVMIDGVLQSTDTVASLAGGDPMYQRLYCNNGASAVDRGIDCDRMFCAVAST